MNICQSVKTGTVPSFYTRGESRKRILHLACHGEISPDDPIGGRLLLSPDGISGGSIEITDLFGIRLKDLSLAFLSGCYTGMGRMEAGDEVLGLSRAFLAAGAESVVVSLWDVEDASTSFLVQEFYRNVSRGQPFIDALNNAQVSALRIRPHLYFWAAFQVMEK